VTDPRGRLCHETRLLTASRAHEQCGVAPGLVSTAIDSFNAHLVTGSPTINAGTSSGAPLDDSDGRLRDALPDIGAYEWRPAAAWVYLPVIRR
jgi:hypothetical protein